MDTHQHSTAPWETSRDAVPEGHVQFTVYAADGARVATVFDREANVPLIAAAPELLEALKSVLYDLEWGTTSRWKGEGSASLRAAIAKAEGAQ